MQWMVKRRRAWLFGLGGLVLLFGLGGAAWLYHAAANEAGEYLGYVEEGGQAYPVLPEDSKQYQRDVELYGGKAGVLADALRRWFASLWRGKRLAGMVALFSVLAGLGCFYAAERPGSRLPPEEGGKGNGKEG